MLSVYKGLIKLKEFKDFPHSGIEGNYFYTPLKRFKNNKYWVKYYKKNTQYYDPKVIKYLEKYCTLEYYKIVKEENGDTGLIFSDKKILKDKNTILIKCISKQDGSYIGCPENTFKLVVEKGINKFWKGNEDIDVSQIGFNSIKKIWYLWDKKNIHQINVSKEITNIEAIRKWIKEYIEIPKYGKKDER